MNKLSDGKFYSKYRDPQEVVRKVTKVTPAPTPEKIVKNLIEE